MKSANRIYRVTMVCVLLVALAAAGADNVLTSKETQAGWTQLFDGQNLSGWRGFRKTGPPDHGWNIDDGCIHHLPKGGGGDLISEKIFDNFEIEWDWKVALGANSGLKYFISEERTSKTGEQLKSPIGHEYQMIDDEREPDARRGPKWQTAAFYDVFPATNRTVHPAGTFNHSRILVRGNHVEHWLNGGLVLSYELGSPEVLDAVAHSKFKTVDKFGTRVAGHILLQDHGDEVWFKNIRIRVLKQD